MNTSFESKFRASITRSVEDLASQPLDADELIRHGRSALRRRRTATVAAAVLAVVVTVGTVTVGAGPQDQRPAPAASGGPTGTAGPGPTATAPATTAGTGTGPSTPAGPAPTGVDMLLAGNAIRTGSGRLVTIPSPGGGTVSGATGVAGGWVVTSGGTMDLPAIEFLTEAGRLQGFQPALQGAPIGFAADGRSMGARVGDDIYVFDLPSLAVRHRIGIRSLVGATQQEDLWLRGDRLVVQFNPSGHGGTGFSGVVIWNLKTGTSRMSPDLQLRDVSADGTLGLLAVQQGTGPDVRHCVSVATIGDTVSATGTPVCGAGVSLTHGRFSPGGTWVAVAVALPVAPAGVWLFRTTQLQAGGGEPARRYEFDVPTWQDDGQLILADERATVVQRCPTGAGACQQVTGGPEPLLGVITNHR